MHGKQPASDFRIALVWADDRPTKEAYLSAIQWADMTPGVSLRLYRTPAGDFQREVAMPLRKWRPHGLLAGLNDWREVERLRRGFANIPLVAASCVPPGVADSSVVADMDEAMALARDYFQQRGLTSLALYCSGALYTVSGRRSAFRAAVPDGQEWVYPEEEQPRPDASARTLEEAWAFADAAPGARRVRDWLQSLPKPVGVIATEAGAAGFLLRQCHALGLKVPAEVQLIGMDNTLECLRYDPPLTSLKLPHTRIGEVAMETLLSHVRREKPPPPELVPVAGCTVVPRGTTDLVRVGAPAVSTALRLMGARPKRGMSTAEMAQRSGVARATLYRHFVAATGQAPARHLRQKRLEEACRMLRDSDATVTAIAKNCGFSSVFAFAKCFRREIGRNPTAYRRGEREAGGREQGARSMERRAPRVSRMAADEGHTCGRRKSTVPS
jgi:LacI family transcriptional regulator